MNSKQVLLVGLLCLVFVLIGIEQTIYCLFLFITVVFGYDLMIEFRYVICHRLLSFSFILHLIFNQQLWQQSNAIYDRIRTSFLTSKLNLHVRRYSSKKI